MCTHSTTRETHDALIEAPRSATKSARSVFGPVYAGPMVRRGMPEPGVVGVALSVVAQPAKGVLKEAEEG
jgi:hypothetical protein